MVKRFSIVSLQVDTEKKIIYDGQKVVQAPPKVVEILVVLLENAGRVVSRDEIRDQVWGSTYVDEANLTRSIGMLRSILRTYFAGVDPIKTFPKRGYQFIEPVGTVKPKVLTAPIQPEEPEFIELPLRRRRTDNPLIEGISAPVPAAPEPPIRNLPGLARLWIAIPLLVCLALVVAGAVYLYPTSPKGPQRPSLAVLDFRNLSGDSRRAWIGEGMRETLVAGFGSGGQARLVKATRVTQAEQDLHLGSTRDYDNAAIQALGRMLGCRFVITGSYLATADDMRFDLELRDAASGQIVTTFSSNADARNLVAAADEAVAKMRRVLGLEPAPVTDTYLLDTSAGSTAGFADYLEGVYALDAGKLDEARALLSRAVDAHPSFPLAHSALASTWQAMGYSEQASKEARLALETASSLPPDQRLVFQANAFRIATDWPKAIEAYIHLAKQFPDDIDYQLDLAECYTSSGNPKQSLHILQFLLKIRGKRRATLVCRCSSQPPLPQWATGVGNCSIPANRSARRGRAVPPIYLVAD